ncbi:MAG: adenylate/guanylate cyclase domain-containing protein [Cyanobium sp.]
MQSKLLTLVLSASLLSLLLSGLMSFGVARHLLSEAGHQRLNSLRNSRAEAIREYGEQLKAQVMTLSEARMSIDASKRFSQGFNQLPDITEDQQKQLRNFYSSNFIPRLKKTNVGDPQVATYYPDRGPERYLKYHYAAKPEPSTLEDAKDGSAWSAAHKQYHKRFLRLAELFGYEDIMIADIKTGAIVYSTSKEDDLGTNLLSGPYADSSLAKVFQEVKQSKDPFFITFSDFQPYKPAFGKPTMFAATTVFEGDELLGALIFKLSNQRIDDLMTTNRKWPEVGMGVSGETYLVGEDTTFRSSPRSFLEDPKTYLEIARKSGLSEEKIAEIQKTGTPILVQPVKTEGARNALEGRTGIASYTDYRGIPVEAAYQPIRFGPFQWGLLAKFDQRELFNGIRRLARTLLLVSALLIPALTLLTLWIARAFIRPIRRLLYATETISSGNYAIHIPEATDDEFGDLATAFNTMSTKLSEREDTLQQQVEENDRLLLSILPSSAASRLKHGGQSLAETHPSVSVLFAEIEGWNELSQSLPAEESINLLNELTSALDDAVECFEVEKLKDVGNNYLAVSGLSRPRIDHEKRAADCGLAMLQVMRRFNQKYNVDLSLDIGLHAGPLSTGVVTGERLSFDIWGKTINIARGIHESPKRNVIQASAAIVEALQGLYRFQALPAIAVKGLGDVDVWELEGPITPAETPESSQLQGARP